MKKTLSALVLLTSLTSFAADSSTAATSTDSLETKTAKEMTVEEVQKTAEGETQAEGAK